MVYCDKQEQCHQQVEGGESSLLKSFEATPGVLYPILDSSLHKRHGHCADNPARGHRNDKKLEHLSCEGGLRELMVLLCLSREGSGVEEQMSLTNVYKYQKGGFQKSATRHFSFSSLNFKVHLLPTSLQLFS